MPKAAEAKKEWRETVYPRMLARIYMADPPACPDGFPREDWPYRPPLTIEQIKDVLGWEDEESYAARVLGTNAKLRPEQCVFPAPTLRDMRGDKVMCWNNGRNRDFKLDWALAIAQDRLNGNWRINGEAVIIGRTKLVLSAQHRLIGTVLAEQMREMGVDKGGKPTDRWRKLWPEPLTLETYVSLGIAEDQQTINTIDNTLARSDADAIATIGLFDEWTVNEKVRDRVRERPLSSGERRECNRMLAAATQLLWQRVGAGSDEFHGYRTHSESAAFRDRHPRLLKCVRHLFEENQERAISNLSLSAGQSAACMYLMGCSASNPEKYRGGEAPLCEENLTWEKWDQASQFWAELAGGKLPAVAEALANPYALETAMPAGGIEKLCVLAKAWDACSRGKKPAAAQLTLKHFVDSRRGNRVVLDEKPSFGGPDLGPNFEPETVEDEMVEEANRRNVPLGLVMDERKEAAAKRSVEDAQAKIAAAKARKAAATPAAPATTTEKPTTARTSLPAAVPPMHPAAGKRAPLTVIGKPAAAQAAPTTAPEPRSDDGRQPPGATVVRPAAKLPSPKLGAPGRPKGLVRTIP